MAVETLFIPHFNARSADEVSQASGSSFLASFRFLSSEKRNALSAVYAFFRIADDCVDELAEPEKQRAALDFWRVELEHLYKGDPKHPVMHDLQSAVIKFEIPQRHFSKLLEGCEMDIAGRRYHTFEELEEYCYCVAGIVGLVCMKIFGHSTPTSDTAAVDLGLAFQLVNILRDVKEDHDRGRIYLPLSEMQKSGYSEDELHRGIENESFFTLMRIVDQRAEFYFKRAWPEFFERDAKGLLKAPRAMARVYRALLEKIRSEHYPVLRRRVSLNAFQKMRHLLPMVWGG